MNYNRITIDPAKYDLQAVAQHEINEVLGTISNIGSANPRPVDLFRYDSAGNRTFTTAGDDAYFSINGTTQLARYNQDPGGDYGDFYSVFGGQVPQVQDAFATAGAIPNLNVELTILDVVGFDRITPQAVPEPGGAALVLTALLGCVVAVRRRRS